MKRVIICLIAVFLLLPFVYGGCGGGDHKTVRLFGTTHGDADPGGSILVQLSPQDGSFIGTIGSVGYWINGLEYDAVSNKLYGTTSWHDPVFSYGLLEIDMGTAVATTIGLAGIDINNLTVNSLGELYGWSESQEMGGGDDLISVDHTTGVASTLGDSGLSTGVHGLAFDNNDVLYLVNSDGGVYSIDTASGAATFTTNIGGRAHHGDFHPETGMYWGIDEIYKFTSTMNLLIVDINAPAILDSLHTADNLHAITFYYD